MATGKKGNLMIVEDSDDSDDLNENIDVTTAEKTKPESGKVSRRNKNRNRKKDEKTETDSGMKITTHGEEVKKKTKGKGESKSLKAKINTNDQDEVKRDSVNTYGDPNTHKDDRSSSIGQSGPTTTGNEYRHMPGLLMNPPSIYPPPRYILPSGPVPAFPGFMHSNIPADFTRWPTNFGRGPNPNFGKDHFNTDVPRDVDGNILRGRGNRSRRANSRRGSIQHGSFARDVSEETCNKRDNHSGRGRGRYSRGRINSRGTSENVKHSGKERYKGTGNKKNPESCDNGNLEMKIYEFLLKRCASFSPFEALLQKYSHFPESIDAKKWFESHRKLLRIFSKNGKIIYISAKTNAYNCRKYQTKYGCSNQNCKFLHICRDFINGWCSHQTKCVFNHKFHGDEINANIIESAGLSSFSDKEIANLLKQQYPKICPFRKTACRRGEMCPYLHICPRYLHQKCEKGSECTLCHSFTTEHNLWILRTFRMDSWLEDAKKDRLLSTVLHLPKFPPRKSRDENKPDTDEQKRSVDEDDVTSDHDSDVTTFTDDNVSVYSEVDQEELSFSDTEENRDSSYEKNSGTEDSEEEEEIEIEEEEKYSRKNRFGPISDTEFLTHVRVDESDD